MIVPIADDEFLPYQPSQSGRRPPQFFEWAPAHPSRARFITDRHIREADGPGQIAWLLEPFFLHPENYLEAMRRPFERVLTHNRWLAGNLGWTWVPFGGTYIQEWGLREKTREVSLIATRKDSTPGHRFRAQLVEVFGDQVDVYGLDSYSDPEESVAPYRYTIMAENERTDGFFTEKLINCFALGTIPIYWGAPDVGRYFDTRGVISVKNINDVGQALKQATAGHYISARTAIGQNMGRAGQYRCVEDYLWTHHKELFQ